MNRWKNFALTFYDFIRMHLILTRVWSKKNETSSNFNELDTAMVKIILIFIDLGLITSCERCMNLFPFTLRNFLSQILKHFCDDFCTYFLIWQITRGLSYGSLIAEPAAILQNWPEDFNGSYFIWSLGNMQFWNKFQCIFIIFSWFHLDNFLFWKNRGILRIFFFDTICPRIHKNGPTCKLCTILEWDKCQQFADFIKFVVFWFALTQSCKTFVSFFMDQTLCIYFMYKFPTLCPLGSTIWFVPIWVRLKILNIFSSPDQKGISLKRISVSCNSCLFLKQLICFEKLVNWQYRNNIISAKFISSDVNLIKS